MSLYASITGNRSCFFIGVIDFAGQDSADKANEATNEPGITHSQAATIFDELKQIRRLLEGQSKPSAVTDQWHAGFVRMGRTARLDLRSDWSAALRVIFAHN